MPDIDSISPVKVDLVSVDHYIFQQNVDNLNLEVNSDKIYDSNLKNALNSGLKQDGSP